jgi:hypothetical protein
MRRGNTLTEGSAVVGGHTVSVSKAILVLRRHYNTAKVHTVAQLVETLCYKSEGRGFNSKWCHWNFSLT